MAFSFNTNNFSTSFTTSRPLSSTRTATATPGNDTLRLSGLDDVVARPLSPTEQAVFDAATVAGDGAAAAYQKALLGGADVATQLQGLGVPGPEAAATVGSGSLLRTLNPTEATTFFQLYNTEAIATSATGGSPFPLASVSAAEAANLILSGTAGRPFTNTLELVTYADLRSPAPYFNNPNFPPPGSFVPDPAVALQFTPVFYSFLTGTQTPPFAAAIPPAPNELPDFVDPVANADMAGNDYIYGRGGNDVIVDLLGDNAINTDAGDDQILLGHGNDRIYDRGGNNTIIDLGGNNSITLRDVTRIGPTVTDIVTTGSGDDRISAFDGRNIIDAGDGNNVVRGGDAFDRITVGVGDDDINVYGGTLNQTEQEQFVFLQPPPNPAIQIPLVPLDAHNVISDRGGSDIFRASANAATGPGDQVFNGNDYVESDVGILLGLGPTFGDDTALLGDGDNVFIDMGGNETVRTGSGRDVIYTSFLSIGAGNDDIDSGAGDDIVSTGGGRDTVRGGPGSDQLIEARDGVEDIFIYTSADIFPQAGQPAPLDVIQGLDIAAITFPAGAFASVELLDRIDLSGVTLFGAPVDFGDIVTGNIDAVPGQFDRAVALDLNGSGTFEPGADLPFAVLTGFDPAYAGLDPFPVVFNERSFIFDTGMV
jgi:Ca2+-binding RTX toxin-like protein